jgi:hypothetical protein
MNGIRSRTSNEGDASFAHYRLLGVAKNFNEWVIVDNDSGIGYQKNQRRFLGSMSIGEAPQGCS